MATINPSDILFATITQHGRTITSLQLCGLSTFSDVLKKLRPTINALGLVTLKLRNSTQGWEQQYPLFFKRVTPPVQLTFF